MRFRELIEQLRLKRETGVVSVDNVVSEEEKIEKTPTTSKPVETNKTNRRGKRK